MSLGSPPSSVAWSGCPFSCWLLKQLFQTIAILPGPKIWVQFTQTLVRQLLCSDLFCFIFKWLQSCQVFINVCISSQRSWLHAHGSHVTMQIYESFQFREKNNHQFISIIALLCFVSLFSRFKYVQKIKQLSFRKIKMVTSNANKGEKKEFKHCSKYRWKFYNFFVKRFVKILWEM